jgi:hypothetical protein
VGSRRRRNAPLAALALLVGCARGAPPGFSSGTSWTIPLIGPLEDGLLLVPALVDGKGPFVFAIDPDAQVSVVDHEVVKATGGVTGSGRRILDENDTTHPSFFLEIHAWKIGTLEVRGKGARIVPAHTFDAGGRRVHGLLGRDIIADSLQLHFDRDRGVVMLAAQGAGIPSGTPIELSTVDSKQLIASGAVGPGPRRVVTATINGEEFAMHLDLGAVANQLRERSWGTAKLAETATELVLVDEVGSTRRVSKRGLADVVTVGEPGSKNVLFVPYGDKRWHESQLEGTLGLDFLRPYSVTVNWHEKMLYLKPRWTGLDFVHQRIGRWGSKPLEDCDNAGCVKVTLIDPVAGKPPEQQPAVHPGVVASIVRDPFASKLDLEVLVAVAAPEGKPPLKWFLVNLPVGADRALAHLPADYVGATTIVVDAGLFPRACPDGGGCVDFFAPSRAITQAEIADHRETVSPTKVKLRKGRKAITPHDEGKVAVQEAGVGRLVGSFRVCADKDGTIDKVTVISPTRLKSYNELIVRKIRDTWAYEPYLRDGKATPFCTAITFIYMQK